MEEEEDMEAADDCSEPMENITEGNNNDRDEEENDDDGDDCEEEEEEDDDFEGYYDDDDDDVGVIFQSFWKFWERQVYTVYHMPLNGLQWFAL